MQRDRQHVPVLIVGGGVGGCAAAMAVTSLGLRALMTEETDWIGGQLTSQAVPPDEHPWIESFGCTRRYRTFRNGVRQYYRDHYPLTAEARANPTLNPGDGMVSRVCHEPRVALAVIQSMLQYPMARGLLNVLLRHKPIAADTDGDRIRAVTLRNLETGRDVTISADYVIDATELGELLPLAKVEYVCGAESRRDTGEPHAVDGDAQPHNVQSFTWCFPLAHDPDGEHVIDEPKTYEFWRNYVPQLTPAYPGRLLDWTHNDPISLKPRKRYLLQSENPKDPYGSLWWYRRIVTSKHFAPGAMPHEVSLINWPQNDYWEGNIIDQPRELVDKYLEESRQLSLSLVYWLQTEAPNGNGGQGYPGLYLRPDIVGTADGLAKAPYIRESRRIRALFTVTENHVGAEALKSQGKTQAETFKDTVGVGCYRIDLHPSTGRDNYIDIASYPFQIPLGALVPLRVENLLPACKNLGVTHITNGCYRLHPVEWNIGESAGLLAGFCLTNKTTPKGVLEDTTKLDALQQLLRQQGIALHWPRTRAV